jgi:hypothetical protein
LSDALQTGLSTGSQRPKGCCGRLTRGSRQEAEPRRHFTWLNFHFDGSWRSPASITFAFEQGPERSSLKAAGLGTILLVIKKST